MVSLGLAFTVTMEVLLDIERSVLKRPRPFSSPSLSLSLSLWALMSFSKVVSSSAEDLKEIIFC